MVDLMLFQGAVQIKIQIWDDDTDRDELVDEFRIEYIRASPVIGRKADDDDYRDITLIGTRVTAPSR